MRDFTLSESFCDQAVVVRGKSLGWEEWFSNPTAGPWKRISIPGITDLDQRGFGKEETRPDLILFHDGDCPIVLILESKDDIKKLFDSSDIQLEKTSKVFENMEDRVKKLILSSKNIKIKNLASKILYVCGYVVGDSTVLKSKIPNLKKIHLKFANRDHFKNFVLFTVKKKKYDLSVESKLYVEKPSELSKKLDNKFKTFF